MARLKKRDRVCEEPGCETGITRASKGRCRPCALKHMHADPDYQARRLAGLAHYYAQPGVRQAHGERLKEAKRNPTPAEVERLREHGRWLYREHASRPEVFTRARSPEARRRAVAKYIEARLGWCPADRRAEYAALIAKHIPAAEARRVIEAEIPGTAEHAKRQIANTLLTQQLRQERRQAEAY